MKGSPSSSLTSARASSAGISAGSPMISTAALARGPSAILNVSVDSSPLRSTTGSTSTER
jgi:hypothetical protein